MSYTVLARKYRSQTFDDVIGQDAISQTLKNAIKTGRVAHAYLFTGTRGIGKTTMARVLAKSLNCLAVDAPTTQPCCKCDGCIAINAGDDIDVIEIDGASNNSVEEVRRLRENAIYRPARARFKIYIIDEVHMLSTSAFNALLKILEEPPSHVKFIFATTEPNKVLLTIQSRCQRFDFSNIKAGKIAEQLRSILKQEKIKFEDDLILSLAKMANGSMRDALSLLDRLISTGIEPLRASMLEQFLGCPNSEKIWNLIGRIADSDAAETLAAIGDLVSGGVSEVQLVDSLIEYMRDLMVVKSAGLDSELLVLTDEQRKRAGELAEKFDVAALVYNITALEKLRWTIKNSDTPRALLEASLLRFALSEHFLNIDQLLSQLQPGFSAPVKKKVATPETATRIEEQSAKSQSANPKDSNLLPNDIQSIKDNWQNILKIITTRLGPGTAGLLSSASPARFEGGVLTLEFSSSGQLHKKMCESNGRLEQIQSALSEQFSAPVTLKLEIAAGPPQQSEPLAEQPQSAERLADKSTPPLPDNSAARPADKVTGRKRIDFANDPAVRTVLIGLDATITHIEEYK
jgi:DNA polymerase-3 subunit gamma/tau